MLIDSFISKSKMNGNETLIQKIYMGIITGPRQTNTRHDKLRTKKDVPNKHQTYITNAFHISCYVVSYCVGLGYIILIPSFDRNSLYPVQSKICYCSNPPLLN